MSTTSYLDQAIQQLKCGDFNVSPFANGDSESQLRTIKVGLKLRTLKLAQASAYANAVCNPNLDSYLNKIDCNGDNLSVAECEFVECQIQLVYLGLA